MTKNNLPIITSYHPPCIVESPTKDITYAMPGWIEVPKGTTVEQIRENWIPKDPEMVKPDVEMFVPSSSTEDVYTVKLQNHIWSCNCPGYGFRKKCKHIEQVKQSQREEKNSW